MTQQFTDIATEALKSSPIVTVAGLTLYGVSLQDWVLILTLVYTVLQAGFLLRDKWWRQRKTKHGRK